MFYKIKHFKKCLIINQTIVKLLQIVIMWHFAKSLSFLKRD